jgi:hypothetical protein
MVFQKVKSHGGPLLVDFLHLGQHLSPPAISGHVPEETKIVVNLAEMIDKLASQ